jgi:hypothetical protein
MGCKNRITFSKGVYMQKQGALEIVFGDNIRVKTTGEINKIKLFESYLERNGFIGMYSLEGFGDKYTLNLKLIKYIIVSDV